MHGTDLELVLGQFSGHRSIHLLMAQQLPLQALDAIVIGSQQGVDQLRVEVLLTERRVWERWVRWGQRAGQRAATGARDATPPRLTQGG